jgi:uncharacterized membrane protein
MATSAAKKPVRKTAKKAGKKVAAKSLRGMRERALDAAEELLRSAADSTATLGRRAVDRAVEQVESGLRDRVPIQVSIDVAVPVAFAWDRWMTFEAITEGVHRIEDVDRDGNHVVGRIAGLRSVDWEAEIVDEREHEAFAWRSFEGSDCAGLVTFHRLSDRLTRLELDLDVLPVRPRDALALTLHLAHRRAEAELRRFKASLEFVSPDVYEPPQDSGKQKSKNSHDGG